MKKETKMKSFIGEEEILFLVDPQCSYGESIEWEV